MTPAAALIFDEPIGAYHSHDYYSSSQLVDLLPTPLHFKRKHIDKAVPKPEGDHLDVGNAAHWAILEGNEALIARVAVHPTTYPAPESAKQGAAIIQKPWNWNANYCKEWAKSCGDRVVLSPDALKLVDNLQAAVAGNPLAAALMTGGRAEVTFRKHLGLFGVQCRTDYWHPNGLKLPGVGPIAEPVIVDLKTCDTIERFVRCFGDSRYGMRAEFYRLVVREVLAEMAGVPVDETPEPRFFFVAVEKQEPFRCEVFEPTAREVEVGRKEVHEALATLAECLRTGIWPGAKPGVQRIERTEWQLRRTEERAAAAIEEREAA